MSYAVPLSYVDEGKGGDVRNTKDLRYCRNTSIHIIKTARREIHSRSIEQ